MSRSHKRDQIVVGGQAKREVGVEKGEKVGRKEPRYVFGERADTRRVHRPDSMLCEPR